MNNLFTELENKNKQIPLAEILRPRTLEDYLGQYNVIAENSPLFNLIKSKRLFSFIFWGPSGCGKTTLSRIIANILNIRLFTQYATGLPGIFLKLDCFAK